MPDKLIELFIPTFIAELAALIASVVLLRKSNNWWPFIVLLLIIVSIEIIGWYIRSYTELSNGWLYNITIFIAPLFYLQMLKRSPDADKRKGIFDFLSVTHFLFFLVNFLFVQGMYQYNNASQVFGQVVLIVGSFIIFISNIKTDRIINPLQDEYFWLASAILISCLGKILIFTFKSSMDQHYFETGDNMFRFTNNIMNFFLYGVLIISFVCHRKQTK